MFLYPTDRALIGKEFGYTVKATSVNENSGAVLVCTFDWVFTVVDVDSKAIWPTGVPVPDTYYANFPG